MDILIDHRLNEKIKHFELFSVQRLIISRAQLSQPLSGFSRLLNITVITYKGDCHSCDSGQFCVYGDFFPEAETECRDNGGTEALIGQGG